MRIFLFIFFTIYAIASGADSSNKDAIPDGLTEQVLIQYLQSHPPKRPFGLVLDIDWNNRKFIDFPDAILNQILKQVSDGEKFFIPSKKLRLPLKDERVPKDPDGKTYRGIEMADTGKRIYVTYVYKFEKQENVFKVYYMEYSGPLAASGGAFIASKTAKGWCLQKTDNNWKS